MAVSATRIVDETTLPGVVRSAMGSSGWVRVDGSSLGCLETWVNPAQDGEVFRDNLVVIVTRFAPDEGAKPADLLDHAFVDGRALPGWESESEDRWPRGRRHSGWAFQSGVYELRDRTLWTATVYVVHDRGDDAAFLVQTTVTLDAAGTNIADRDRFVDLVRSVIFAE
ncbi:LpqN/LpqT family lipoprotein [Williamsia sp. M5A3_1d]